MSQPITFVISQQSEEQFSVLRYMLDVNQNKELCVRGLKVQGHHQEQDTCYRSPNSEQKLVIADSRWSRVSKKIQIEIIL